MRATRPLTVRLASLGGVVALAASGLTGAFGLAGSAGPAGADTPSFTATCTGLPVLGTTTFAIDSVTGAISPSSVGPGTPFNVSGFSLKTALDSATLAILVSNHINTFGGDFTLPLTATGATPGTQTATFAIPTTPIPNPPPTSLPLVATGSVSSFTADASGATSVSLTTGTSSTISPTVNGAAAGTFNCTQPAQPLATAPIAVPAGVIKTVLPNAGPASGGSSVKIIGSNLLNPKAVTFGGVAATSFRGLTADSIEAVTPPGTASTSPVFVQVTTSGGKSNTGAFTYTNGPVVTGLSPSAGPPAGGTSVAITGEQLTGATAVDFGSTAASSFTVNSATSITAVAPPGSGVVDVTVTGPSGISVTSAQDRFSYRQGYWLVASDGGVFDYGSSPFFGSAGAIHLNKPIVGMASTPDGGGYWLVASDGGIFAYGDAQFFGSTGNITLNKPIVGMAPTPDGYGYWLVASDGGVFAFGDAQFFGSMGGHPLNKPIVGITASPDGNGYWMVASDGGIFSFGDAKFHGSAGGAPLNSPAVAIAATPNGGGYWITTGDGGIFSYPNTTPYYGSLGGTPLISTVAGMARDPGGTGYWLATGDGGIFNFGSAPFYGSLSGIVLNAPVIGMAAVS